jgi:outer membrane protein TolC
MLSAALLLGISMTGVSVLQGAVPENVELTLGEALQKARDRNPALQRQLLEQVRKDAELQETRGALLPSLQAQASEVRHSYNYEALLGTPAAAGTPVVVGPFSVRTFGAYAQAPLLDLSLWRRWRETKSALEATKAETDRMREEISALVVGQYLLALRAEAQVRAVQARIELAKALEELAVHQEESGVGTRIDTLRAKVRTQTEGQALIQARTSRQEALSGLVRLLDLPTDCNLEVKALPSQEPPPAIDLGAEVSTARSVRADFRVLEAESRAADERVEGIRAQHFPSIQAFASLEDMGLVNTSLDRVFEVGVQVKVPLFMGGRIEAQASEARAAHNQVEASRRELEARVGFELRTAKERLEAARSEWTVTEEVLRLAKAELEQARHRFEAGVSNNIELVNAQEELAKAEEGNLDARYRMDQAEADLAHARGDLETHYAR